MYIHAERVKQLYRLLFLALCEAGIVLQYAAVAGFGNADNVKMLTCYYTVLSNILCFVYFAILMIVQPKRENALIKGAVTMCISITGLVYHFMLNGVMEASVGSVTSTMYVSNLLLHYIVPCMVVLDYLLFAPKGQYKTLYPLAWLVLPYVYFGFAMVRAEVSSMRFSGFGSASRYPYPFLDVDLLGWDKVILIVLAITAAVTALGYLSFVIDRLLGKKLSKRDR